jgi:hypothetical protein
MPAVNFFNLHLSIRGLSRCSSLKDQLFYAGLVTTCRERINFAVSLARLLHRVFAEDLTVSGKAVEKIPYLFPEA